jgi:hypothetical protein
MLRAFWGTLHYKVPIRWKQCKLKKSLKHFKSSDFGLKCPDIFQKNPKICFLGEKSPKLSWQPWYKQISLAWPGDFSPYENCLQRIVYTLMADFPYGENLNFTVKIFFTVTVLCNGKYPKMHEAANRILFKF